MDLIQSQGHGTSPLTNLPLPHATCFSEKTGGHFSEQSGNPNCGVKQGSKSIYIYMFKTYIHIYIYIFYIYIYKSLESIR